MILVLRTFLVLLLSPEPLAAKIDNYNEVSKGIFVDSVTDRCERYAVHSRTIMECSVFCSIPERPRCFGMAVGHDNYCWVCGEGNTGSLAANEIPQDASFWIQHDVCRRNPCGKSGICSPGGLGFRCKCGEGWTGDKCNDCKHPWLKVRHGCYYISTKTEPLSWKDAKDRCKTLGGRLVKIEDGDEEQALEERLDINTYFWIGLNDRDQEGTYEWVDGTIATYEDWKNEYPGAEPSDPGHSENCVVIHADGWADITCHNPASYICEL